MNNHPYLDVLIISFEREKERYVHIHTSNYPNEKAAYRSIELTAATS